MTKTCDTWGNWKPYETTEEYDKLGKENMSYMDLLAYAILEKAEEEHYEIKTDLTTMAENLSLYLEDCDEEYVNVECAAKALVYDIGLKELDTNAF